MKSCNLRRFLRSVKFSLAGGLAGMFYLCLAVLASDPSLLAQEEFGVPDGETGESQVRVSFGSATAHADATVEIPFYLTAPFDVGVVESALRLPKGMLEFVKARKSEVLESRDNATLETSVADDSNDKTLAVVKLSIRDSSDKGLPSGLLALVTLKVAADAKPGAVKLDHQAIARATTPGSKNIAGVVAESPQISIAP